ncbi:MAG: protein jag, partial [Christensenellales bacterium]
FDASVEISETKDAINIEVVGKDANKIIGKRGDGLNAFQYLCSIIGSRSDRDCGRVYANACDYKEEREQELIKLARKLKYSAIRDEKAIKLEPMSALDRKTIHKALKDDELVATHSEGEEPRRYIVIEPKKQEKLN